MLSTLIFTSCASDKKTQRFLNAAKSRAPYDVIIVPGFPFDGQSWDRVLKIRICWAIYLYEKGITKNIIFSGSAVYTPYVESKVMEIYAKALGIPSGVIFIETKAEHSTENLYYSYKLAKRMGFKKIALATDPFQDNILRFFKNRINKKVDRIPVVFSIMEKVHLPNPVIDSSPAYIPEFVSLMKRESFRERFRGTRGKKIVFEKNLR